MRTQATSTEAENDVDLLTREQAWKRLNCSQRHLHDLVSKGDLPHVKIGKLVRFISADLDAYIEAHRIGGGE
jgi:excisionase family DNA binding protein